MKVLSVRVAVFGARLGIEDCWASGLVAHCAPPTRNIETTKQPLTPLWPNDREVEMNPSIRVTVALLGSAALFLVVLAKPLPGLLRIGLCVTSIVLIGWGFHTDKTQSR